MRVCVRVLPPSVVAVVVEMYGVSVSVGARPSPRPRRAAAAGGLASRGTMLINLAMVAVAERGGWWAEGRSGRAC